MIDYADKSLVILLFNLAFNVKKFGISDNLKL